MNCLQTMIKLIFLLLLFTFSNGLEPCPFANDVKPCECFVDSMGTTLQCSNIRDKNELQRVFDNCPDFPMFGFTLKDSSIPHLNASWFLERQFNELKFQNLTLLDLFENSGDLTIPKVTSVELTGVRLMKGMVWTHFRAFNKLVELRVYETEVKKLGKEFKENVSPSLIKLWMAVTKTEDLDDEVFSGKENLKIISMQATQLRVIKKSFFKDQLGSLIWIDFSYNPLETVPDDLFEGMDRLRKVNLAGTGLKTLPKQWDFSGELAVMENPLMCDCKMSWIPNSSFSDLIGTCESPSFLKSKELEDLTEEDFKDCKNALPFEH